MLGLISAEILYKSQPEAPEGELSYRRSRVVRQSSLAKLSEQIGLGRYIRTGRSEQKMQSKAVVNGSGVSEVVVVVGVTNESILADVFEAVMAAMYIDGGYQAVCDCYIPLLTIALEKLGASREVKGYLQEVAHKCGLGQPRYVLERQHGPDHLRTFYCSVRLSDGRVYGQGMGCSKKEAEQASAKAALIALGYPAGEEDEL